MPQSHAFFHAFSTKKLLRQQIALGQRSVRIKIKQYYKGKSKGDIAGITTGLPRGHFEEMAKQKTKLDFGEQFI